MFYHKKLKLVVRFLKILKISIPAHTQNVALILALWGGMIWNTLPVMMQSKSLGERLLILRFLYSGGPSQ